ncbi:unnamed protein product [Arctogadus glacialis]
MSFTDPCNSMGTSGCYKLLTKSHKPTNPQKQSNICGSVEEHSPFGVPISAIGGCWKVGRWRGPDKQLSGSDSVYDLTNVWRLGVTNGGVGVRRGTQLNSRGRKKRGPPPQHRTGLAVTEGGRSPGALIELLSKFTDPLMDPHIQNHLSLYLLAQSGCVCVCER